MRRLALACVLLFVAAGMPPVAAQEDGCSLLQSQCDEPRYAEPILVYGEPKSGHRSMGWAYNGSAVEEYPACFYVKASPDNGWGAVLAAGLFNPETAVDLRFEDFYAKEPDRDGGLTRDIEIFQGYDPGWPLPGLRAEAAGWGNATLDVNFEDYPDPVNPPPVNDPTEEFQTEANWTAMFFLTKQGIRDNGTKAIPTRYGVYDPSRDENVRLEDDWEAHMVLRNHTREGEHAWSQAFEIRPSEPLEAKADNFRARHRIFNTAYGGTARLTFELTTVASPLTSPDLTFEVLTPSHRSLGNWTLRGTPSGVDTKSIHFPLDELADYVVSVRGNVTLSQYRIQVELQGPDEIVLNFWWEDLLFGRAASLAASQCRMKIHGDMPLPADFKVLIPEPKGLNLKLVVLGISGALIIGLATVKLILDQVSMGSFLRGVRKR